MESVFKLVENNLTRKRLPGAGRDPWVEAGTNLGRCPRPQAYCPGSLRVEEPSTFHSFFYSYVHRFVSSCRHP